MKVSHLLFFLITGSLLAWPALATSGYVENVQGVKISSVNVTISNATYSSSYSSNSTGYWNVNIYADGNYNYSVVKKGYLTQTGSQASR